MIFRVFLSIFLVLSSLSALSEKQLKTLQQIRDIAKTIPNKKGETFENTLSAICLTESSAGVNIIGDFKKGVPITKASLGAMQIQIATARFMGKVYKPIKWVNNLSDAKLANRLLTDVNFSAIISAYYMRWLSDYRKSYYSAVSGYNGGLYNKKYYTRVAKNMKVVRAYVKKGLLK